MNNPITTISREQLVEMRNTDHAQFGDISEMARALLAVMDAKPYGYVVVTGSGNKKFTTRKPRLRVTNEAPVPVYTAQPLPITPPGWKLVPVKPTVEMYNAWVDCRLGFYQDYDAILAAAPSPETST